MGLPIFRYDNDDVGVPTVKSMQKQDPTAHARSAIRRRPSIHRGRIAPVRMAEQRAVLRTSRRATRDVLGPQTASDSSLPAVPTVPSSSHAGDATRPINSADHLNFMRQEYFNRRRHLQARQEMHTAPAVLSMTPVGSATGLGDRVRSPSPISHGEDYWQAMRSTIQPDRNLPSEDSSVTGAAASASFGSSVAGIIRPNGQAEMQGTLSTEVPAPVSPITAEDEAECDDTDIAMFSPRPDDGDLNVQYRRYIERLNGFEDELRALQAEHCSLQDTLRELDDGRGLFASADTSQHDTRNAGSGNGRPASSDSWAHLRHPADRPLGPSGGTTGLRRVPPLRRSGSLLTRPSNSATNNSISNRDASAHLRQARQVMRQASSALAALRQMSDTVDGNGASSVEEASDLEHMRGVLERLAQRQDIPDGFWASVGLSRDVVRQSGVTGPVVDGPAIAINNASNRDSHL